MPPLRLLLDARMARSGGIGTYITHLIPALIDTGMLERCCVMGSPPGALPAELCHHPYALPVYSVRELLDAPANPHGAHLWHSPHFNIPRRWKGPLVVTIHDMIVTRPSWIKTPWAAPYAAWRLRQALRRADALITASAAAKQAFCEWGGIAPDRVTVIPHGVAADISRPVAVEGRTRILAAYGVRPPFILWVSAIRPHKNPLVILRAFAALRARDRVPHQLVMIGHRPAWYTKPAQETRRLRLGDAVRWIESVPGNHLPALYQSAQTLVMPSYEEGFGLPVLEAMAAGLPVLVSATPALLELVENAGVAIAPDDVDGWCQHLYTMISDEDLRRRLQQQGRIRAGPFTWARTAARHIEVYRTATRATAIP